MSNRTLVVDDRLYDYLLAVGVRESAVLARLRQETAALPMARMQISPEQGQLMGLLVALMGARRCLEVGTFTGYSALVCAAAMPADGRLIACDLSEEWTSVARRYWAEAGVASKIELRLGPAVETLTGLVADGQGGTFDFAFIDADKTSYARYLELGLELLRPGGLLAFDNVLWSGRVAHPGDADPDTVALRDLNARLHRDRRVDLALIPIGDGLTLARKRP